MDPFGARYEVVSETYEIEVPGDDTSAQLELIPNVARRGAVLLAFSGRVLINVPISNPEYDPQLIVSVGVGTYPSASFLAGDPNGPPPIPQGFTSGPIDAYKTPDDAGTIPVTISCNISGYFVENDPPGRLRLTFFYQIWSPPVA